MKNPFPSIDTEGHDAQVLKGAERDSSVVDNLTNDHGKDGNLVQIRKRWSNVACDSPHRAPLLVERLEDTFLQNFETPVITISS